jgi:hypothetical protein
VRDVSLSGSAIFAGTKPTCHKTSEHLASLRWRLERADSAVAFERDQWEGFKPAADSGRAAGLTYGRDRVRTGGDPTLMSPASTEPWLSVLSLVPLSMQWLLVEMKSVGEN